MSMSDELREELQTVRGVGDAKADEILEIVESNSVDSTVEDNLRSAWDYYQDGQYSYAEKFLRRAIEGLE